MLDSLSGLNSYDEWPRGWLDSRRDENDESANLESEVGRSWIVFRLKDFILIAALVTNYDVVIGMLSIDDFVCVYLF